MECSIDLIIMGSGLGQTTLDETTVAALIVEGLPLFLDGRIRIKSD